MFIHKIDKDISLKLPELRDAEKVYALTDHSREHLQKWLPWLNHTKSMEDTKSFIEACLDGYVKNKSLTTFILYRGDIVGTAGFNQIDWSNQSANIGYWLGKDYQGLGIMTRVVKALTAYAIEELYLNRVDIRAAEENKKSRAIPERLGFTMEGRIREAEWLYDHFVDHIIYGMLAREWKQNRPLARGGEIE